MSLHFSKPVETVEVYLPPRSRWLHPIAICSVVWLGILFLYSLHLSYLLNFTLPTVSRVVFYVWLPFVIVGLIVALFSLPATTLRRGFSTASRVFKLERATLEKRLKIAFLIWFGLTIIEIIHARGVALLWALLHTGKNYQDYGIPSVHGFVDALLLSIGLCHFVLALSTGSRRSYAYAGFVILWTIIIINRNMMLVALLEYIFIFLTLKQLQRSTVIRIVIGAIAFVFLFGIVGDIRQPEEGSIRKLAEPTEQFPDWLPSGFLWAYIYATSPVQNLTYNVENVQPIYNPAFPNTFNLLLPTVVRDVVYGHEASGEAFSGQLEVSAFNVSTAFEGSFQDYGILGIILLSGFLGMCCEYSWLRSGSGVQSLLIYSILMQCLVLTTFFNHFFTLPVITQVLFVSLLCNKRPLTI